MHLGVASQALAVLTVGDFPLPKPTDGTTGQRVFLEPEVKGVGLAHPLQGLSCPGERLKHREPWGTSPPGAQPAGTQHRTSVFVAGWSRDPHTVSHLGVRQRWKG